MAWSESKWDCSQNTKTTVRSSTATTTIAAAIQYSRRGRNATPGCSSAMRRLIICYERAGPAGADRHHRMTIPRAQEQLFDRRTSAREKYAQLVVGRPGWRALVKHELITLAAQNVPGALGLALRQAFYPSLLGACGRGVVFGQ